MYEIKKGTKERKKERRKEKASSKKANSIDKATPKALLFRLQLH